MTSENDTPNSSYENQVDQQDGGPGSHSQDGSAGEINDVASGGGGDGDGEIKATEARDGAGDGDTGDGIERDVHGDPDTVS